jgi:endonuclease/exonuclease/phosphatase family metal-dependent hydrolase
MSSPSAYKIELKRIEGAGMDKNYSLPKEGLISWMFFGLVFLLFFQLVSDFIETIYTFGLLGTDIPPEIVSVLLFFTPLILLLFPRGLPVRATLALAGMAAVLHPLEVMLDPKGKMLLSGLGVGCLFALLPALLVNRMQSNKKEASAEMGAGLTLGLALSILLRSLGAGSDLSLSAPWLSWLLALGLLAILVLMVRRGAPAQFPIEKSSAPFSITAALSVGTLGGLMVLYFAFSSPTVLARWTGLDYRLVVIVLAAALALYVLACTGHWLSRLSKPLALAWNALFLLVGTVAIWTNQVSFPPSSNAYPVDQPALAPWQQIPFWLMLLLSPIILLNFHLLVSELAARKPAPRAVAGGFSLAALFFLVIVLAQVFTTVYDYIPVAGPWLRDRFWLVFLLAGLGMALPVLAVHAKEFRISKPVFGKSSAALVLLSLIAADAWVVASQPVPTPPGDQQSLQVLTYNIQQGYSADGRRAYSDQLEVIQRLKPDLVGLQETDVARFSGGNADIVRTFSEGLGMYAYYGPKTVTGTFGIALLSRYPLQNPRTFFMSSLGEQTAAIQAQITVNGKTYQVLVTHLGNHGPIIQQQQVLKRLTGLQNLIAMGDFNFDQSSEQYALTIQTLEDAWVSAGSPPAAGVDMEHLIDHLFVSPGIAVQNAQYIASPASDHPALLVEIAP